MADFSNLVLGLCILFPCAYLFLIISRKTSKLPPGPVGFPVVGSLFQLGNMPNESLARLSKLYGPLMALRLGFRTTVVVSSPEMARETLHTHDQDFSGRPLMDASNNHSTISNTPWQLRRICSSKLFAPKRLDALRAMREQNVRALIQHIRAAVAAGRLVDIGDRAFGTVLNMISNTLFSHDVVDLGSESMAGEFKSIVWGMLEVAGKPNLADFFPLLRPLDPQGLRRQTNVVAKRLYAVFDEAIDRRLQILPATEGEDNGGGGDDFLAVLLELGGKQGSGFNRLAINAVLADLFVAGSDTSSNTIEWAMTELLRHPEKMSKAQSELREVVGIDRCVTEADIPQLAYLDAVVKETLRLHPPAPLLVPRKASATTEVAGFIIPKDAQVLVNVWAIGRDLAYWESPNSFLPERFMRSDLNFKGKNFQFIPFGAGSRICPGMPLAVRMVPFVLASLIHSFSWELPDGMAPEQLSVEAKFGLSVRKAVPLRVLASPSVDK
ncbi:unnamed protein product [Victoria cruziana]